MSDAGTYTCIEEGLDGEEFSVELMVMESHLECQSNITLHNVLVENDCGIDPDYIGLSCDVRYRGNFAPVLKWQSHYANMSSYGVSSRTSSIASTQLSLKAYPELAGEWFTCHVEGGLSSGNCSTTTIATIYLRKTSEYRQIQQQNDESPKTCMADTNQKCEYKWIRVCPIDNTNVFQIHNATLGTANLTPGFYRCVAKCEIRNTTCTVEPIVVEVTENKANDENIDIRAIGRVANLVIFLIITSIIGILLIIVCSRFTRKKILISIKRKISIRYGRWRQRRLEVGRHDARTLPGRKINQILEMREMRKTQKASNSGYTQLLKHESVLLRTLDCNPYFLAKMRAEGVLSGENVEDVEAESTSTRRNKKLIRIMKGRSNRQFADFLDVLRDIDQPHVAYLLEGHDDDRCPIPEDVLQNLVNKKPKLMTMLEDGSELLCHLRADQAISEADEDRIVAESSRFARTSAIIDAIARRSMRDFEKFVKALDATDQKFVADYLTKEVVDVRVDTSERNEVKQLPMYGDPVELTPVEVKCVHADIYKPREAEGQPKECLLPT